MNKHFILTLSALVIILSLTACGSEDSVTDAGENTQSPVTTTSEISTSAAETEETLTEIITDEKEVTLSETKPEIINSQYIENLITAGKIDVTQDAKGCIIAIDGRFTEKTADSAEAAADVLNSAADLFGDSFHAEAADIIVQQDCSESFYRYTPKINDIPVNGSQIILSAKDGQVTGLFSSYNKLIESINTENSLTAEEALKIADNDFFNDFSELTASLAEESGLPEEEVIGILRDSLTTEETLMINFNEENVPELVWVVSLKNEYLYEDNGDGDFYVDFDNIYDYGKYMLSAESFTYYILANGDNAGKIEYKDSGMVWADDAVA